MVTLRTQSVDDEAEETSCATFDEAIARAKAWFLDGYDNDTIPDGINNASVKQAFERIERDLRAGGEFSCNLFYERITIT